MEYTVSWYSSPDGIDELTLDNQSVPPTLLWNIQEINDGFTFRHLQSKIAFLGLSRVGVLHALPNLRAWKIIPDRLMVNANMNLIKTMRGLLSSGPPPNAIAMDKLSPQVSKILKTGSEYKVLRISKKFLPVLVQGKSITSIKIEDIKGLGK
jgi:hypothetical protein